MKNLLFILLFFSVNVYPQMFVVGGGEPEGGGVDTTEFYVRTGGDDTKHGNSNDSAWATIAKVNASSFDPGDVVYFKCGDTWRETLTVPDDSLTFMSYGTGNDPVISGFTEIPEWTNNGGGVYSKTITCESNTNVATFDGVNMEMGRWPNNPTFNTYEAHTGTHGDGITITDNELTEPPDWVGAEIVVRKSPWSLERGLITAHVNTIITYNDYDGNWASPNNGYGYFIQNDTATLDVLGEWQYDGTDFFMYFGAEDPTNYAVEIGVRDTVINVNEKDYVKIDGLDIRGGNFHTIDISNSDYITIQNCDIDFSGDFAIWAKNTTNTTIDNNTIDNTNSTAIYFLPTTFTSNVTKSYSTISNNTITNTGLFGGMLDTLWGIDEGGDALSIKMENMIIEDNRIYNSGHSGIRFSYDSTVIQRNLIDTFALVRNDAGGIYAYSATVIDTNSIIEDNIVLHGIGASGGQESTGSWNSWIIAGIYLDVHKTNNGHIFNNTVSSVRDYGIYLQNTRDVNVDSNLCYNNGIAQLFIADRSGFDTTAYDTIQYNQFICNNKGVRTYDQDPLWYNTYDDTISVAGYGLSDYNYLMNAYNGDNEVARWDRDVSWVTVTYDLWEWIGLTSNDANSDSTLFDMTVGSDSIYFQYNYSADTTYYVLVDSMYDYIDIDSTVIAVGDSVVIRPYGSVVLFASDTTGLVVYTDDFEALTSGQTITGQGNWIAFLNDVYVGTTGADKYVYSNTASSVAGVQYNDVFNNDQYAQIVVDAVGAADFIGVGVRMSGSAETACGYGYYGSTTLSRIFRIDNGVKTNIDACGAWAPGDVLRIEISGTTITVYKNGVIDSSCGDGGTETDATYSSGKAGIIGYGNAGNTHGDLWEGGDK